LRLGYTARVRIFVRILLVAVVLNLADWPYVDEIFGSDGPVSALLQAKAAVPVQHSRGTLHAQPGYQLLLGLQALPCAAPRLQPQMNERIVSLEERPARYLIPPRIDRPPIGSALS
jgi:hypothetical protein